MKSSPNLLVADDNPIRLEQLDVTLKKLNLNLILAKSISEALGKTKGKDLFLAIINIQMPKMNGYKLALKINSEESEKKVPVIFFSASHFNEKEVLKGYASGAVDFINKPVNYNILVSKIKIFLNLFNQKQAIIRDAEMLKKTADKLTSVNVALKKSEEKYRSYIDNAPDGVFVASETGKFIDVNNAVCRITGHTKEELLEMSISDLITEESFDDFLPQFKKVFICGTLKADLSFKIKTRTKLWGALEAVKLNENRVLGFIKNITKRFELEESLRTHHIELEMQNNELMMAKEEAEVASRKYSNLYEFAPSGYFTLSADKEIQELNYSGSHLLGLSEQRTRLVNNYFDFFISKTTLPVFNTFFSNVFNSKVHESCEVILETEDNQPKYIHIEGVAVDNGQQCHLNIIDITQRKQAEEEIRLANSFLDSIVENIPDMIFIKDAKSLRFKRINRAGEELLGIPKEEIVDRTDYDFFPKEQADHVIEKDRNILLTREMMDISEEEIQTRNNGIRVIHTKKVPILNPKGEPEYLLGISEDITDRKLAEYTLKISEEKYKTMLNSSPDGILLVDLDGIITEVSDIGLELFGADTRDDLVGKYFNQFVPSDEKNTLNDIFEKAMNEGLDQNVELKIKKKNQFVFAAETSATLIQESDGTPLSFMLIIRDISQRRKMETKQIHADRMANLGEMASGIAHEINQPLNIISMVVDKILFITAKYMTKIYKY